MRKKRARLVRLAILGTGNMGNAHAASFKAIGACQVVAACDIDETRVKAFAANQRIPSFYTDAGTMLRNAEIDAVTIVTPDRFHAPLSIQCLKAGKHVLCEKPLALNYVEARKMVAAARKAGVVNMVNFTYRNWPCIQEVAARIRRGDLGNIVHVKSSYAQTWLTSKVWGDWRETPGFLWRLSTRHGSNGALGDVGVHIADFTTFPVGPIAKVYCRLKAFPKAPRNRLGAYILDANDSAAMTVEFKNGALGVIHTTRWASGNTNRLVLKIFGTRGAVEIDSDRSTTGYRICIGKNIDLVKWEEVEAKPTPTIYERFIRGILTGQPQQPDFATGAEIQKLLDACFLSNAKDAPVRV